MHSFRHSPNCDMEIVANGHATLLKLKRFLLSDCEIGAW